MSGLVKAKKYDWKDSNLAMFGSDTEKQVKKESAESEPAWAGAGQEVGLQIWRINQFEVEPVPEEDNGTFYKGDSYILLNTYKEEESDQLEYDVHFWIGAESTQDEYGTAAYKTVELDTFLDDKAVQHREVQGHESRLFMSYFTSGISMLSGGHATGFRHVEPTSYTPRLLHIEYTQGEAVVNEVPLVQSMLKSGDVYIYDNGMELVQLNGSESQHQEKTKAAQMMVKLTGERPGASKTIADEGDSDYRKCKAALSEEDPEDEDSEADDDMDEAALFKVTDADGSIGTEEVKTGDVSVDDLDANDVFLVHFKKDCFVWVGSQASIDEKRNGFAHAINYLKSVQRPYHRITVLSENDKNNAKIATALAA